MKCVGEGNAAYRVRSGTYRSIMKKLKQISDIRSQEIIKSHSTKQEKKENVKNLLNKHYGTNWRNLDSLQLYKTIIDGDSNMNDEEELVCELMEDTPAFNV